jgi:hypothetical protein
MAPDSAVRARPEIGMLSWFDGREATTFGLDLADFFAARMPDRSLRARDAKSLRKSAMVAEKVFRRAAQFRLTHPLNMFKRAKLVNAFQWRLFELGYDRSKVEELARNIARVL